VNGHDHREPVDPPGDDDVDGVDEIIDDDGMLGDQLRLLLGPSDGLDHRTARDVDSALRARSPLAAAFELFGVGWWTAEVLFTNRVTSEDDGTLTGRPVGADGDLEGR